MLEKDDIERLMTEARIELTGASDEGIKTALFSVFDEFFRDSLSWREHLILNVTAGIQHYKLINKDGGRIFALFGVWDGYRLGVPSFMPEPGELHVRWPIQVTSIPVATTNPPTPPALSATNPWVVEVAENVKKPATRDNFPVAPHWVLQLYYNDILDGLLGRMMGSPAKSYSNLNQSAYHLKRFRQGIQIARTAAARQNTIGAQTWRFPQGWGYSNQRGGMVTAFPPPTGM